MKKQKMFLVGTMAVAGALSLGGLSVYADELEPVAPDYNNITQLADLKTCLESTEDATCKLGGDIVPTNYETIEIPVDTTKVLQLAGHKIDKKEDGEDVYKVTIYNRGELTIEDATGEGENYGAVYTYSDLTINGGVFYDGVYSMQEGSSTFDGNIVIKNGVFEKDVLIDGSGRLTIKNGIYKYVTSRDAAILDIEAGTFDRVSVGNNSSATIKDGVFGSEGFVGSLSASGASNIKVVNGEFKSTVFCGQDNSLLEIIGGKFVDLNCISYHPGSKLTISGGTFTEGFSVGVETLKITGGKFLNGKIGDGGWLALIMDHPEVQSYSITGGEFINTRDEWGKLIAINMDDATEEKIKEIFKGGNVLDDKWIEVGERWSYVMKVKTEDDLEVPDTGANTMEENGMNPTSIVTLIAGILCGAFALGISAYLGFHKKVSFKK